MQQSHGILCGDCREDEALLSIENAKADTTRDTLTGPEPTYVIPTSQGDQGDMEGPTVSENPNLSATKTKTGIPESCTIGGDNHSGNEPVESEWIMVGSENRNP